MWYGWPYTDLHSLNLDWILNQLKTWQTQWKQLPAYIKEQIEQYLSDANLAGIVQNVLQEYGFVINVKVPGNNLTPAKGDGSTDDTAALQAMIAYGSSHGMPLLFPAGTYRVSGLNANVDTVFMGSASTLMLMNTSSNPLISVAAKFECYGMTLNGNIGGQTTPQNVINCVSGSFLIDNCHISSGKSGITGNVTGECRLVNSEISNFSEYGLYLEGSGSIVSSSVTIPNVASGGALRFIRLDVSNSYIIAWSSLAEVSTGIELTGDNNYLKANFPNVKTPVNDGGQNNNWEVAGKSEKRYFNGNAYHSYQNLQENVDGDMTQNVGDFNGTATGHYALNGTDVILNPSNPLTYKTPSAYNNFFKTIPFKDASGTAYDVLVKGEQIADLKASCIFASVADMKASNINFSVGDILLCISNNGNNVPSYWKVVEKVTADLMHNDLQNNLSAEFLYQDGDIINVLALGISNTTSYMTEARVTDEIQWLLDNGYIKLFFPKGSYAMSIKITKTGTWILGEGQNDTVFEPDDDAVLTVDSTGTYINWCLFSDFHIDGRTSDYVGIFVKSSGINSEWLDQSYFRNLYLSNGYNGMRWMSRGIWNVFDHVWFYGNKHEGLYVAPGAGCAFNHNSFNDCEFAGNQMKGFAIEATSGEQINAINFNHCGLEQNWFNTEELSSSADFDLIQCHGVMFADCYIEAGKGAYNFNLNQSDAIFSGGCSLVPNSPLLRVVNGGFCKIDMLHGYQTSGKKLCTDDSVFANVCVVGSQSTLLGYQINEGVKILW